MVTVLSAADENAKHTYCTQYGIVLYSIAGILRALLFVSAWTVGKRGVLCVRKGGVQPPLFTPRLPGGLALPSLPLSTTSRKASTTFNSTLPRPRPRRRILPPFDKRHTLTIAICPGRPLRRRDLGYPLCPELED
jgi:hypothetical protein